MPKKRSYFRHVRPKLTPEQRLRVKSLAIENIHLLYSFVNKRKNLWILFEGQLGLQSELSIPYMKAIKQHVLKEPKEQISTYIVHHLNWGVSYSLKKKQLIHVPESAKCTTHGRQAKRVFHFSGTEGRRNDSSLLHHDPDLALLLENKALVKRFYALVKELNPKDQKLVLKRLGDDGHGATLQQLGAMLGVTKVRARQRLIRSLEFIIERLNYATDQPCGSEQPA